MTGLRERALRHGATPWLAYHHAALEAANRKLELLSATDGLTGVANRRKFDETLEREWHRSVRMGTPLGLVMLASLA